MSEICGIILAAGESTRMGRQKLLLPFQGKTIIGRSIENVLNSQLDQITVVLGSDYDEIFELIRTLPVSFCLNENYKNGMLSSVKCAIYSLPVECEAVLIFPGDQPMIEPEAIDRVIEVYRSSSKGIVIPCYQKKKGHPVLIDRKYFSFIEKIKENEGLRSLAVQHPEDVLLVDTNCQGILKDIDTKEEYEEISKA